MIYPSAEEAKALREANPFNVRDEFKYMSLEEIKAAMLPKQQDIILVMQNSINDFNLSSALRNTNAFGASEFWVCGKRLRDSRGAVGANHYTTVRRFADTQDALDQLKQDDYTCIAVEQTSDSMSLYCYDWEDEKIALFYGEEGTSLEQRIVDQCDLALEIPMYGTVRSLNLATTAGIILYAARSTRARKGL